MRFLMAVLFVAAASMPGHGATIAVRLALCSAKGATLARLACYDELARSVNKGAVSALPSTGIGKWIVDHSVDPLDDTWSVMAFSPSEDYVHGYSGALIEIACLGGDFVFQLRLQADRVKSKFVKKATDPRARARQEVRPFNYCRLAVR